MNQQRSWRERWMPAMKSATELTRTGRLGDATAIIQRALSGLRRASPVQDLPPRAAPATVNAPDVVPAERERLADDGSFTLHAFEHPGTLTRHYKLFVPPQGQAREAQSPMALIVMLHGCTQDPDDFAAGTAMNDVARRHGFVVMYPEQTRRANPQRCWNWFSRRHQTRDVGEPGLIAAMTRHVVASHGLDAQRVYAAGLSAGGAMAAILGNTYPDIYAAIGVHSGLPAGAAGDVATALQVMKTGTAARTVGVPFTPVGDAQATTRVLPTIVLHGDADTVVHARNGDNVIDARARAGLQRVTDALTPLGQHAATRERWLDAQGRVLLEQWQVRGGAHAWFGGNPAGSYTDARGPDASDIMVRFFLSHRLAH